MNNCIILYRLIRQTYIDSETINSQLHFLDWVTVTIVITAFQLFLDLVTIATYTAKIKHKSFVLIIW